MPVPETPLLTVDIVIDLPGRGIVLIRRKNPPHGWALPGGFVDRGESCEAAAVREAREETALELALHPVAPRPFDLDIHEIPERPGEPAHFHLDVRYLLVGRGDPCEGAAWYPIGTSGDGSVDRLAAKAAAYR
jgi:ADP-ribose pyrophosphatase YjhB (NUDIX family)